MTLEASLRQSAALVLECAIRLAPQDTREWGQAMRGELNHVESPWTALMWALGGAGVLMKHALAALLMPGDRGLPLGRGLFARNVRKVALVVGSVFLLATLVFFAAPPFRQGLRVSLTVWNQPFQVTPLPPSAWNRQGGLRALSTRAEAQHDPEGLVFAAARLVDARESARLADEAVRLDPRLLWLYAIVAVRHPDLAEIQQWIPRLEQWDPQNALPYLITAESIDIDRGNKAAGLPRAEWRRADADPAWQSAMAAAFAAPNFDDYLDRLRALDGKVVRRYGFNDPYAALSAEDADLPTYSGSDAEQFAASVLQSGRKVEARGDRKTAAEEYWRVARFGQVLDSQTHTVSERLGLHLQVMSYRQLQALVSKEGNAGEAAHFSYLAAKFEPTGAGRQRAYDEGILRNRILGRNALALEISGLLIIIFSGLLVIAASILIAASRRGMRAGARPARSAATLVAAISATGLFLSSATVYLTYRPYWYIFQRALLKGDDSQTSELRTFLDLAQSLPGARITDFRVQFWWGVILLGIIGLILILLRHLLGHTRADELQHSPHVQ